METEPTHGLSDEELADLARLADGTLPAERRSMVEARVAASPQLASIVENQRATLDALRAAAGTEAPARLRADVERRRGTARSSARRPRRLVLGGAVAAAAAVVIALVLILPAAAPSIDDAASLASNAPTQAAPASVPGTPQLLSAKVDDVPFPNYAAKFGWKPVGARADEPSGRDATTVFYRKGDRSIAYTIVSGDALDPPSDARTTTRAGVKYRTFRAGGRNAVTWERGGQTCVLSGDAPSSELVALADWRGQGAIPF